MLKFRTINSHSTKTHQHFLSTQKSFVEIEDDLTAVGKLNDVIQHTLAMARGILIAVSRKWLPNRGICNQKKPFIYDL